METHDTPPTFGATRLRLGAAAGILGPAFILARITLEPGFALNDVPGAMTAAAAHPTLTLLVNACQLIGFGLAAFAACTLTGLVRGRGKWLTQIGGWGTTICWLVDAFNSLGLVMASEAQRPDRSAMVDAVQKFQSSPSALLLLVPLASSSLWVVVLPFGIWRARLTGVWYPAVAVLSLVSAAALEGRGPLLDAVAFAPTAAVVVTWSFLLHRRARTLAGLPSSADPAASTAAPGLRPAPVGGAAG